MPPDRFISLLPGAGTDVLAALVVVAGEKQADAGGGSGGDRAPVSDRGGIGVELVGDGREKFPPKPRPIGTRPNVDGSVIDQ